MHMSTLGGHFARLAVISRFFWSTEVAAIRRLECTIPMAIAIGASVNGRYNYGGVRYSECPLREVPLYMGPV